MHKQLPPKLLRQFWITEARTSFVQTYNDQYAPSLADSDHPPTLDPFENDGVEDDFLLAVFGSQSSTFSSNAPSELEVYLEEPVEGGKVYLSLILLQNLL